VTLTVSGTAGVSGAIANVGDGDAASGGPIRGRQQHQRGQYTITSTTSRVTPSRLTAITLALLAMMLGLATAIPLARRRRS
jgi:hypothetical protein